MISGLVFEWQRAEKNIVDEAEYGGVESNPERQGDHRNARKRRRLAQFAKRESKVVHVLIPFEVPGRDRLWPLAAPGDNTRPMRHTRARKLPQQRQVDRLG